jgi:tripartite-type tricarboxylate transporter receptor subunit TctC
MSIAGQARRRHWIIAGILALTYAGNAAAQNYPTKTIRLVVAFAAGGPNDVMARIVAQRLSQTLGRQVIVDNRPGAGGTIGTDAVAKSPADGYTLLFASGPFAFANALYRNLPYDSYKDFTAISMVASSPMVLARHPSVPLKSVRELLAYAKTNPGKLNYGSGGVGSTPHLATSLLQFETGARLNHVPFKGGGPALVALMGGEIDILMDSITSMLSFAQQGKIKPMAVSLGTRSPKLPDVPTIAESGVPGFSMAHWVGIIAPAKTPQEIISKLNGEVRKALESPEVRDRLTGIGAEPSPTSPAEFQSFINNELDRWVKVVKSAGITPQ